MGGMGTKLAFLFALTTSLAAITKAAEADTLTIGYSDWPGYVAWQIPIEKGWFKDAGLDVKFQWFDYSASLDAFSAKKLDAVTATHVDTLVTGAGGAKGVMVLVLDYSSGNDMLIADKTIKSVADLKGKKIGVEVGVLEQLVLDTGLEKSGLSESDVTLVNSKTNDLPQVLASGQVSGVVTWQPISNTALQTVAGSHSIYTTADAPGLLYDVLTVDPVSLATHHDDWLKLVKIWDRTEKYILDPKTQDDAVKIMSARDGLTPAAYKAFLGGTHLFNLEEGAKILKNGPGVDSLYGSAKNADAFNVRVGTYKASQPIESYIDPSLTAAALK